MAAAPLAGCYAGVPPKMPRLPEPPQIDLSAGCKPVDQDYAYDRIRPQPEALRAAVARAAAGHVEVRAANRLPPPPEFREGVRVFTWGSFLPGRYSLVAVRDVDGGWTVVRASEGRPGGRVAPEQPSVTTARITGDAAARLEALLSDRCLYGEPSYYDRSVPTPDGGQATCADGSDALVEIRRPGMRHTSFHACHTFGRAGQVASLLWMATAEPARP